MFYNFGAQGFNQHLNPQHRSTNLGSNLLEEQTAMKCWWKLVFYYLWWIKPCPQKWDARNSIKNSGYTNPPQLVHHLCSTCNLSWKKGTRVVMGPPTSIATSPVELVFLGQEWLGQSWQVVLCHGRIHWEGHSHTGGAYDRCSTPAPW